MGVDDVRRIALTFGPSPIHPLPSRHPLIGLIRRRDRAGIARAVRPLSRQPALSAYAHTPGLGGPS